MSPRPPREHHLRSGSLAAAILEQGATLRSLTHEGEELLDGFPPGELSSDGRGQVLAPFPNRLAEGRYVFGGRAGAVAWNEPERQNAIHGLVRWSVFEPVALDTDALRLATLLAPSPAYPFLVELEVAYVLSSDGLMVRFTATNQGEEPAPFGIGFHPYFATGPGGVDAARLAAPARERLVLDERGLPTGRVGLVGTDLARLRDGLAPIGPLVLDDCLTDLAPDGDGRIRSRLVRGDGRTLTLAMDAAFGYLMVFSGDTLAPERRRRGLALEPMTCPPNALATGTDLLVLTPGESASAAFEVGVAP